MANLVTGLGGSANFGENFLFRNDDEFTSFIDLRAVFGPNGLNFFGQQYTGLFLNNNGSVTFGSGISQYTPDSITGQTSNPIIAPFWADVDTRNPLASVTPGGTSTGSNLLWYDLDSVNRIFTATWDDVGYFNSKNDKLNAFQLRLIQVGNSGDFDIEFRYEAINWTTGDASDGVNGLGGVLARAGYSSGNGVNFLELTQSGDQAALLGLETASNVGQGGVYRFSVRSGSATPSISVTPVQIFEGNDALSRFAFVSVTLAAPSADTITVQYATSNGTAIAGNDYLAQSGLLTFAPGVTEQTIFIEILGDLQVEADESFFVTLRNPVNAPIGSDTAAITIFNDDGLSISDVTQSEGSGTTPTLFTFTVTLPTAQTTPVTVNFATEAGTATSGSDFAATSGTLTFAAGETSKTVTVNIVADTVTEADETFIVRLSNATGAPIADATATGTITNDDGLVIDDISIIEGTGTGTTSALVTVRLLSAATVPVTVNWQTADGSALAGVDYTQSSGALTFAVGETSKTITIPIIRDALAEPEETLRVLLSGASGAVIVDAEGTVRVLDDDGFSISDAVVTEGQSGTRNLAFQVTLASALSTTAQVSFTTSNGTATAGTDFTATSGTLTFSPGVTTQTINVLVSGDTAPEADETLSVTLSNPFGTQIVRGIATGTIYNDDGVSISDLSVVEGPSRTVAVTVSLSGAAAVPVTVSYQTQDGTATAGLDYVATSGSLTFAAGEVTKTINVSILNDAIFEGSETFRILLSPGTNATIVDGSGTVSITNDDAQQLPSLRIVDASITEGSGSGSSFLRFQVALSQVLTSDATVNYTTVAGTATANADFTPTSGQLTIAAGQRFAFISVPVVRDFVIESAEVLTVQLSAPSSNVTIAASSATGIIFNDDVQYNIMGVVADAAEGNSGTSTFTFTVQRIGDSLDNTAVDWSLAGSGLNPASANDFAGGVLPGGALVFAFGETSKTIVISVAGDTAVELDESFVVQLSNPSPTGASLGTAAATGIIRNDDSSLAIAATTADQTEGNSGSKAFTFTVTRSGSTTGASTANWAVTGSGASAATASDFAGNVLPSGTVSFAAGETSKVITVNVNGDSIVEPDDGFTITLSAPSAGTSLGTAAAAGIIRNDDASLAIAATTADQTEGNSGSKAFTFTVTRSGSTTGASTANWAVTGSGANAADATDFAGGVLPSGTVSFAAGETSKVISVNVNGDSIVEPDDGFTLTLSAPSAGTTLGTATATGIIRNDDTSLAIVAADANKAEGNSGTTPFTFTVTRSGSTTGTTTVNWAVTGTGANAASPQDFAGGVLPSGTLNFAANQTTATITLAVAGNTIRENDEAFSVTLSSASNASIVTATAAGVIINDDLPILGPQELFLRQQPSGGLLTWDSTRGSAGFGFLLTLDPATTAVAAADFTGDGRAELLFRQSNQGYIAWNIEQGGNGFFTLPSLGEFEPITVGIQRFAIGDPRGSFGTQQVAIGDLRGSFGQDMLLQAPDGQLRILEVDTGVLTDLLTLSPGFRVVGVGNIDGQGRDEIVFQNDNSGAIFALSETGFADLLTLSGGFEMVGLGNVTGSAADDFIFRNVNTGVTIFWDVSQGGNGFRDFATVGNEWSFSAFADLNGDGRDDVLLRNTNGNAIYWSGTEFVDLGSVLSQVQLVGVTELG